ncbi:hypothetical protein EI555_003528, partial [Monodon monoceros]
SHDTLEAFLSKILAGVGGRGVLDTIGTSVSQARAHASPRLLSVSCADCTKHQEPPRKKLLSEKKLKRHFVDHRRVLVRGGRGGDGVSCFHSEPRKEFGGPDGGDGGYGGHYQGFDGGAGGRKNCFGRSGAVLYIQVPVGTLVKEGNKVLADLSHPGDEFIAALGGAGGKGNRFFLANSNRAPTTCTPGQPGQERVLFLELKTVAHAGLVGFPNAGKSSLLRAISNARPTVASYPFTTLNPHVGVVHCEDHQQIAVADIPGIVRGAHQNRGLGLTFLRHIERCPFLLFVLDLSVPEPWTQLDDLKYELEQYREGLSERPHAVVANKVDLPQARARLPQLQARLGREAIALSAATGENLEGLLLHLKELHDDHVAAELERGRQPLRLTVTGDKEGAPKNQRPWCSGLPTSSGLPTNAPPCPGPGTLGRRTLTHPPVCSRCFPRPPACD